MSKSHLNRVLEGIDANLPHLHQERWAREAADLRDVVDRTTGIEQDNARQALREHYKTQFRPETSRGPLVEEARARAVDRRRA